MLVLQPTCTLAALQLSQLQPLVTLRSLELTCAPCWQHTGVLLGVDPITAAGLTTEMCSGCLHNSVGTQHLGTGSLQKAGCQGSGDSMCSSVGWPGPGKRQRRAGVLHVGASIRAKVCRLGVVVWRRVWCNEVAFDELSVLTQVTRLAINYHGSTQREMLYSQLAQLTWLRELDARRALQTDGGKWCHP